MPDREACERRVYRLATLLTGDRVAAVRVIEAVLAAQPRLDHLDDAHLDRLTVLRSREIRPAILFGTDVHGPTAEALSAMVPQEREAWVLVRVFGLPLRSMAKAMDCSVTASERHLNNADDALRASLGDGAGDAAKRLRGFVVRLDTPEFFRARRAARRRARRMLIGLLIVAVLAAAGAALLWSQGAFGPEP